MSILSSLDLVDTSHSALVQENQYLRSRLEEQRQQRIRLFSRNVYLNHVNVALENFAFIYWIKQQV
jgi:hypothetical protein